MDVLNFIVYQLLTNQTIFLGIIALVGLLLQKKAFPQVIDGVVKTVIGLLVSLRERASSSAPCLRS